MAILTAKQLCDATGISPSYAHMILSGDRPAGLPLSIRIYRATGWKPSRIAAMSDAEIAVLERMESRVA